MAENKKSFVLYADLIHLLEELPDDIAGRLFKTILRYVNDQHPAVDELMLKIAFEPIKQQLKRDLRHWEEIKTKRSKAGLASAEKREQIKQKATPVEFIEQKKQVPTVTENDTVTVNDTVIVIKESIEERKLKFASALKKFSTLYPQEILRSFYDYWTEPNKSNTKFRQELEKTWDTALRLKKWNDNNTKFDKKNGKQTTIDAARNF